MSFVLWIESSLPSSKLLFLSPYKTWDTNFSISYWPMLLLLPAKTILLTAKGLSWHSLCQIYWPKDTLYKTASYLIELQNIKLPYYHFSKGSQFWEIYTFRNTMSNKDHTTLLQSVQHNPSADFYSILKGKHFINVATSWYSPKQDLTEIKFLDIWKTGPDTIRKQKQKETNKRTKRLANYLEVLHAF